jgi:hypothetical protein
VLSGLQKLASSYRKRTGDKIAGVTEPPARAGVSDLMDWPPSLVIYLVVNRNPTNQSKSSYRQTRIIPIDTFPVSASGFGRLVRLALAAFFDGGALPDDRRFAGGDLVGTGRTSGEPELVKAGLDPAILALWHEGPPWLNQLSHLSGQIWLWISPSWMSLIPGWRFVKNITIRASRVLKKGVRLIFPS